MTKDFPGIRVTCVAYRSENYDIVQLRKSRKQKQKPTSEQILAPLHYSGNAFPAREGEEEHIKPGDVVAIRSRGISLDTSASEENLCLAVVRRKLGDKFCLATENHKTLVNIASAMLDAPAEGDIWLKPSGENDGKAIVMEATDTAASLGMYIAPQDKEGKVEVYIRERKQQEKKSASQEEQPSKKRKLLHTLLQDDKEVDTATPFIARFAVHEVRDMCLEVKEIADNEQHHLHWTNGGKKKEKRTPCGILIKLCKHQEELQEIHREMDEQEHFDTSMTTLRDYQLEVVGKTLESAQNCVVVMETGMGKTIVAIERIRRELQTNPESTVFFAVPTRILALQHTARLFKIFGEGKVASSLHQSLWNRGGARIFIGTADKILRKMEEGHHCSLVVVDECHKIIRLKSHGVTGRHEGTNDTYCRIVAKAKKDGTQQLLGLTATPKSFEDLKAAFGEARIIRPTMNKKSLEMYRTHNFATVKTFGDDERRSILCLLLDLMQTAGFTVGKTGSPKEQLLEIKWKKMPDDATKSLRDAVMACIELPSKVFMAERNLFFDALGNNLKQPFAKLIRETDKFENEDTKYNFISAVLKEHFQCNSARSRAIIFVRYRSTAQRLSAMLKAEKMENVLPNHCVGTAGRSSCERLKSAMEKFEEGESNVMVGTSVLSEGLDIASCNLIIMISPPDNGVQLVQMIGRARQKNAKIFVLATSAEKAQWEKVKKEAEAQRRLLLFSNHDDIPNKK